MDIVCAEGAVIPILVERPWTGEMKNWRTTLAVPKPQVPSTPDGRTDEMSCKNGNVTKLHQRSGRVRVRVVQEGVKKKCRFNLPTCPGCPDSTNADDDETKYLKHRLQFIQSLEGVHVPTKAIRCPSLWRTQLAVSYTSSFFPTSGFKEPYPGLHGLLKVTTPRNIATIAATDALFLLQHGTLNYDDRLLNEGRSRYGRAVQLLRPQLEKSDAAFDDTVLGAVAALALCEMYASVTPGGHGEGWRNHRRGLCALLGVREPEKLSTPFTRSLVKSFREAALLDALLTRKALVFGEPRWLRTASNLFVGPLAQLSNLAMRAPALLEKADMLAECWPTDLQVIQTLNELVSLEGAFHQWLENWHQHDMHTSLIRRCPVEEYKQYCKTFGSLVSMFSSAMTYPTLTCALTQIYYWMCLLMVRLAIQDVARLHKEPLLRKRDQDEWLNGKVYECADSLCEGVPYFFQHHNSSLGGVLATSGPLQFAAYSTLR